MKDPSVRQQPPTDFRELYSFSKRNGSGSSRSISSRTTNRSSATCPASNTAHAKEEKKHQKRKFRTFANWLMRFLERKDPRVFGEAQEVIRDCEQRKKRGEAGYESVTDSLKEPLREVVGKNYWREARFHLDSILFGDHSHDQIQASSSDSDHENASVPSFSCSESTPRANRSPHRRCPPRQIEVSPFSITNAWNVGEEKKIRRERFYMLLRVLMKYLETKDHKLFLKAKAAINDCVERSDKPEDGFKVLSSQITRSVKRIVGDSNWRRAESYLAKTILQQAITDESSADAKSRMEEELMMMHQPLPLDFIDEPLPPEETVHALSQRMGEDEEQEFFVNVCDIFTSSAKRTIEEQTTILTSSASKFCLKGTDAEIETEPTIFDRKRRRLQASTAFGHSRPRF